MSKIKRCKELLTILDNYEDVLELSRECDNRLQLNNMLGLLKTSEEFGIDFGDLNYKCYSNFEVNIYTRVLLWGKKSSIGWSDDGKQPKEGDLIYMISFSTGAYIFGEHYPVDLFKEFFLELKSYNPKYLDTVNHSLYFTPENAKVIHNAFPAILKKYKDRVREDYKRIRKEKLEKELKELEDN